MSAKRRRIGDSTTTIAVEERPTNTQTQVKTKPQVKEEKPADPYAEFYDENGEFLWEKYESTCPTQNRKPNPHVKTQDGDVVFSIDPYAQ